MEFPKVGNVNLNQFNVNAMSACSTNVHDQEANTPSKKTNVPIEGTKDFNQLIGEYAIKNRDTLEVKGEKITMPDNTKSPEMFVSMEILNVEGDFTLKEVYDKARKQFETNRISDSNLKVLIINTVSSYKKKNIITQKGMTYSKR